MSREFITLPFQQIMLILKNNINFTFVVAILYQITIDTKINMTQK